MTRWLQTHKKEHFYKEAKRRGFRARSAFKLQQIQNRFHLFSMGDIVVDLGAAPGGWSQVAKDIVGPQGRVIGVDLLPITPLEGVVFLQGDISSSETFEALQKIVEDNLVDVVISDMSPDISGNYSIDQARSVWLCEQALQVADKLLKPGGHFLCKIFEGEDTPGFLAELRQRFYIVKPFSPSASRKSSSEVYIVAKSLKRSSTIG